MAACPEGHVNEVNDRNFLLFVALTVPAGVSQGDLKIDYSHFHLVLEVNSITNIQVNKTFCLRVINHSCQFFFSPKIIL